MRFEDVEQARRKSLRWVKGSIKFFCIWMLIQLVILVILILSNEAAPVIKDGEPVTTDTIVLGFWLMQAVPLYIIIGTIIILLICVKFDRTYKNVYKNYFVITCLNRVFGGVYYDCKAGLDQSIIQETGLINMGNDYKSDDLVVGEYKGASFSQADVLRKVESGVRVVTDFVDGLRLNEKIFNN